MASSVTNIGSDEEFQPALAAAGGKLVVVDFFANWCGPCRRIAPAVAQLATKYPNAVFLKVDVDECGETAAANGVTAMPTFLFFRNKIKLDLMMGADANSLEEKIKKWIVEAVEAGEEDVNTDVGLKSYFDLIKLINKSRTECLNESDEHPLVHGLLQSKDTFLESDCDEQLIISIEFVQAVKLYSLKINGPSDIGPKNVKVFINQPHTMSFDEAEGKAAVQDLELTQNDLKEGAMVELRFVKFQCVTSITLFIKDNMTGAEKTQIDYLGFIGCEAVNTNMAEFKRVAGKMGESHY